MKILLISSEPLLAELIAFRLELLGHTVDQCDSLASMLSRLESDSYKLLISDTVIPDCPASDAIAAVRNRYSKDMLSILVLSIDPSLELVEQLYKAGADDYLLAPFEPNTLQTKIERLLVIRKQLSQKN